ncbi:MAG: hypothetical protein M1602_00675 [Firmicutes bacterium]|nr:hypothetical protein [Bacillota bacterium]
MKLEPGERSILASFTSWTRAEDAVKALKEAGLGTVQLARAGKYAGVNDNSDFNDPVRSQAATLSGLTQLEGDEFPSRNAGPLIAADPRGQRHVRSQGRRAQRPAHRRGFPGPGGSGRCHYQAKRGARLTAQPLAPIGPGPGLEMELELGPGHLPTDW